MPTLTTNYSFNKPLVNNATDADLWGGQLNSNWDDLDTELKSIEDTAGRLPVGSVYMNASDSTNPATLLGYGTWTALGVDRVLIGHGSTYTAGGTGGSNTQTLSTSNMPSHDHTFSKGVGGWSGLAANSSPMTSDLFSNTTYTNNLINNSGSGSSFSIVQAYEVVYMWKRTA